MCLLGERYVYAGRYWIAPDRDWNNGTITTYDDKGEVAEEAEKNWANSVSKRGGKEKDRKAKCERNSSKAIC